MAFWVILASIAKAVLELKQASDFLGALSSGRLVESIIRRRLTGAVLDSIGSDFVKHALDSVEKAVALLDLDSHLKAAVDYALHQSDSGIAEWARRIDFNQLRSEAEAAVVRLADGILVGNGKPPTRNQATSGDPILLARGEFEHRAEDFQLSGAGMDLSLTRTYRSAAGFRGSLGPSWDHSLNYTLVESAGEFLSVTDGRLGSHEFVRHPRWGERGYSYFAPQDGEHTAIRETPSGYEQLFAGGGRRLFEPSAVSGVFRATEVSSREGHFLRFIYDDSRLVRVFVNSTDRHIDLEYDEGLLVAVRDHAGRSVRYSYDGLGRLVQTTGPSTPGSDLGPTRVQTYEYEDGSARITEVRNTRGAATIVNQYERNATSEWHGSVVAQQSSQGEVAFEYRRIEGHDEGFPHLTPDLAVDIVHHEGVREFQLLSMTGQPLIRSRVGLSSGRTVRQVEYFQYNEDGNLTAHSAADGSLTQYLFARDQNRDPTSFAPIADVDLFGRLAFGNVLASVRRAERDIGLGRSDEWEPYSGWLARLPAVTRLAGADSAVCFTYTPRMNLQSTVSDPRFTFSVRPPTEHDRSTRAREYRAGLTAYSYTRGPLALLREVNRPASPVQGVRRGGVGERDRRATEQYTNFDARGRPQTEIDPEGYRTFFSYYGPGTGPKEGFLRSKLIPTHDLRVRDDAAALPNHVFIGDWSHRSNGSQSVPGSRSVFRFQLDCSRVELHTYLGGAARLSPPGFGRVAVSVDGRRHGEWDQAHPTYAVEGLSRGMHHFELRSTSTSPMRIARVLAWSLIEFDVDKLGRIISVVDGRGVQETTKYNDLDLATERIAGRGNESSAHRFEYDGDGSLVRETVESRRAGSLDRHATLVREHRRDALGRLLQLRESSLDGKDRRLTRYSYNSRGLVTRERDFRGAVTLREYDSFGSEIRTRRAACTPLEECTRREVSTAGRLLGVKEPGVDWRWFGHATKGKPLSGYDAFGNLRVETGPGGDVIVRDHDKLGNELVRRRYVRSPEGSYELQARTERVYDVAGRLWVVRRAVFRDRIPTKDPRRNPDSEFQIAVSSGAVHFEETTTWYDRRGRVVSEVAPGGARTDYQLDGVGVAYARLPNGDLEGYERDAGGNITAKYQLVADGRRKTEEAFGEAFVLDAFNRVISAVDAFGGTTVWEYDSRGFLIREIDQGRNESNRSYNAFGELERRTVERRDSGSSQPRAIVELYAQAFNGRVKSSTDPMGNSFIREYDVLGRTTLAYYEDQRDQSWVYSYYPGGRVRELTSPGGVRRSHEYDPAGRLVFVQTSGQDPPEGQGLSDVGARYLSLSYCGESLVTSSNEFVTMEVEHDSCGRPVQQTTTLRTPTGALEKLIEGRTYGPDGRLSVRTLSDQSIEFIRDELGRVVRVVTTIPHAPPLVVVNHFVGSRLRQTDLPNGSSVVVRHDGVGRELNRSLREADGSEVWSAITVRDARNNVRVQFETSGFGSWTQRFWYNSVGWLIGSDRRSVGPSDVGFLYPARQLRQIRFMEPRQLRTMLAGFFPARLPSGYFYDDNGNRVSVRSGIEPHQSVAIAQPNRLSSVDGNSVSYNLDGMVTKYLDAGFAYDPWGAVVEISRGRSKVELLRDAMGRVVGLVNDGDLTFRTYDGSFPTTETRTNGAFSFVSVSDAVCQVASSRGASYLIRDDIGSPRALVGPSGQTVGQAIFSPFGLRSVLGAPPTGPLQFAGLLDSGLPDIYLAGTRAYHARLGRFLQEDPATDLDGPNRYVYAANDPRNRRDSNGLQSEPVDPQSPTNEPLPRIEHVFVNAIATSTISFAVDPVLLILSATKPGAAAEMASLRAQLREQVRPYPYAPEHAEFGDAFEDALGAIADLGFGLAAGASASARGATRGTQLAADAIKLPELASPPPAYGPVAPLRAAPVPLPELVESRLLERAESAVTAIHGALPEGHATRMRTSAALIAKTKEGKLELLVATGKRQLDPNQRALAEELGQVAARFSEAHAEEAVLEIAARNGWDPVVLKTNRDFCPICRINLLEYEGPVVPDLRTMKWPHNFPKTGKE